MSDLHKRIENLEGQANVEDRPPYIVLTAEEWAAWEAGELEVPADTKIYHEAASPDLWAA